MEVSGPREASQETPRRSPGGPQEVPRRPKESPKDTPRSPGSAQEAPRRPQKAPKTAPRRAQGAQEAPRSPPGGPPEPPPRTQEPAPRRPPGRHAAHVPTIAHKPTSQEALGGRRQEGVAPWIILMITLREIKLTNQKR